MMSRAEFVEDLCGMVFEVLRKRAAKNGQSFVEADSIRIVGWLHWTDSPDFSAVGSALVMLENAGLIDRVKLKNAKGRTIRGFVVKQPSATPEPIEAPPVTEIELTPSDRRFLEACGIQAEAQPETVEAK